MIKTQNKVLHICMLIALLLAVILSGCQSESVPRLRVSDYFGAPGGIRFPDPNKLGPHSLHTNSAEKVGLIYTCKGGFIDMGHLREAADRAYYASGIVYEMMIRSEKKVSFKIIEPSWYHLTINYPNNWRDLSNEEKQSIVRDISVQYGQYLGHLSLIWHEILTWYGYSSTGLFSENISSFSCEDTYSDVLGTYLGAKALLKPGEAYEETMTELINDMLQKLDAQPAAVAKKAAKEVKGNWYEGGGYFFVRMKKRNFDVGTGDGFVTPWLVPGICAESVTKDCPIPNPQSILNKHDFKMRLELEMTGLEKGQVYRAIKLKSNEKIRPPIHFPKIIDSIITEAQKAEGPDVGKNYVLKDETEEHLENSEGISG